MKRGFLWCGRLFAVVGVLAIGVVGVPSSASATGEVIRPVRDCGALRTDFPIPGAVTHVTAAEVVPADPSTGTPAYCNVEGFVEPAVQFQLRLPTTTYSGRYLQYGCGGRCGLFDWPAQPFPACGGPHGGDLAVAATNDGHVAVGPPPLNFLDTTWAANNQAARDDFAYRGPHVVSLAAKRIIVSFYGSAPRHSYFNGCSNGGREAMLLAQRYPHDFNGIIAAAPALSIATQWGIFDTWVARANTAADGSAIITGAKLPGLHDAVVTACDGLDGLVDGQLDDPRPCQFDPATVQCPPGTEAPGCLTPAQVTAVRKLYDGPRDEQGRRLHPGWEVRGSELAWDAWITPFAPLGVSFSTIAADNYLRYMGYPIGTPHSSFADFQFTAAEFLRLTPEGVRANALSLDLREFRRAGGKLLLWHGWADQSVPAVGTVDYYQRLWQRNGGLRETQEWARLFMVPGLYHCAFAGDRLTGLNPFPELVNWVERGHAPDRIIATGTNVQGEPRTRPVYPYPMRARYDGTGSIDDATNFLPVPPAAPPHDTIDWVGTFLHDIPGPVARTTVDLPTP